jgi:hypothetical protein
MVITNYRVQSVLRTYTRQLQRSNLTAKADRETGSGDSGVEKVSISGEGKNRLMMDRVTSQVLEKMYPKQDDSGPAGNKSVLDYGPVTEGNT